ncbi:MAG: alpha/beta hydrolase [Alphaproteobacteria bacterium]|nr:alpha/beta hydrolase [Alphaproteobacteria bacterium]
MKDILFEIPTADQQLSIRGIKNFAVSEDKPSKRAVFHVHGIISRTNEYLDKSLLKSFLKQGYDVFRFQLHANFPNCRKLMDCGLSDHASDLNAVLEHFAKDYEEVYLTGHSLGGAVIMLAQPRNIKAISLWDPCFDLKSFFQSQIAQEIDPGHYLIIWNIQFLIGKKMVDEACLYGPSDSLELSKKLAQTPIQVIHPRQGTFVTDTSWHSAGHDKNCRVMIEDAGHCFDENDKVDELLSHTLTFFEQFHEKTLPHD